MYFVLSTRKSFSSIWKIILVQIDLKGEAHRKVYFGVGYFLFYQLRFIKKTLSHLGKGLEVRKQIYCIRLAFRKQQHLLTIRIPERQGKKHKAVSGD